MSLSITILPYNPACDIPFGSVQRVWLFDPADFDFTQAAASGSGANPYSAVARVAGATALAGAKMYPISFRRDTAEYTYKKNPKNGFSIYEHQLEMKMPNLSQLITRWNQAIDAAGICAGVGLIILMGSGKIFVVGEKVVNGAEIPVPLFMTDGGSSGTTGKLLEDENAQTTILKGNYIRGAYEFTGGMASITALQ